MKNQDEQRRYDRLSTGNGDDNQLYLDIVYAMNSLAGTNNASPEFVVKTFGHDMIK